MLHCLAVVLAGYLACRADEATFVAAMKENKDAKRAGEKREIRRSSGENGLSFLYGSLSKMD